MKKQLGRGQEDNYTKNNSKKIEEMCNDEKNNETEPPVPYPNLILMNKGISSTWISR